MSLVVDVRHRMGEFALNAAFASEGGITALFGASGSGKTSLINIIAGLLRPDAGRISLDGDVIFDTTKRLFTPPQKRHFGYVFQEARLFPHLSVARNLTYGRWFFANAGREAGFDMIVDLLGIASLLDRAPSNLSGGEKQRVAIGRALLSNPRLLLMDEPLAALDEDRKAEILPYLERLRDETKIPIIYVSHSMAEVARLADSVVALEQGRVTASGPAATILSLPLPVATVSRREAGVLIEGLIESGNGDLRISVIRAGGARIRVPRLDLAAGKRVRLHIAARDVMLATQRPEGISALNILAGRITEISDEAQGMVDVRIDCGGCTILSRITALSRDGLALGPDKPVHVIIKSVALDR